MSESLLCKMGLHKPVRHHHTYKCRIRTTDKGRSKKRYHTCGKVLVTVTYCGRCGRWLGQKEKFIRRRY